MYGMRVSNEAGWDGTQVAGANELAHIVTGMISAVLCCTPMVLATGLHRVLLDVAAVSSCIAVGFQQGRVVWHLSRHHCLVRAAHCVAPQPSLSVFRRLLLALYGIALKNLQGMQQRGRGPTTKGDGGRVVCVRACERT